jgi:hypothetical protein
MNPRRAGLIAVICAVAVIALALVAVRSSGNRRPVSVASPRESSAPLAPPARESREKLFAPALAPPLISARQAARRVPTTSHHIERATEKKPSDTTAKRAAAKNVPDRPIARQALDLVGADPIAEAIWVQAINDPAVSPHDRQDLIEDLNENGFDDPAHPSADDLPLIENRIAIIEELAPLAMDDVNAAAFAEAYKDLINMHAKALSD